MTKGRLEAFSDGVIAILITIMVLELKVPHGSDLAALRPMVPTLLAYVLSFLHLAIYWNNHHHLLQAIRHVNGRVLWANVHLLFWLSLVPFMTAWIGEHPDTPLPAAFYGVVLLMAGVAYTVLVRALIAGHGKDSLIARAIGNDFKGRASLALYLSAIPLAYLQTWIAFAIYAGVAVMWLVPDRRIERTLREHHEAESGVHSASHGS